LPTLDQLGFSLDEQFDCQFGMGAIALPATIAGENVALKLETALASSIALSLPYAESRGFYLENRSVGPAGLAGAPPKRRAYATVAHLRVLGRDDWPGTVYAADSRRWTGVAPDGRPIAGGVGLGFFRGGCLGLDLLRRRLAFSHHPVVNVARPRLRFALAHGTNGVHAATTDIRLAICPHGLAPCLLIDSGTGQSAVTQDYLFENVGLMRLLTRLLEWTIRCVRRRRAALEFSVIVPGEGERWEPFHVVRSLRSLARQIGLERVDGWLGTGLLASSVVVFDLINAELLIWRGATAATREA
jgi:hypothetical protein